MTDWQLKLDLTDIWEKSSKETAETDMVPVWFVDELLKRLNDLHMQVEQSRDMKIRSMAEDLTDIIIEIEVLKTDEGIVKDDFNLSWDDLYNWADTSLDGVFGGKKMCWIATQF